jgi:hypothetical protein
MNIYRIVCFLGWNFYAVHAGESADVPFLSALQCKAEKLKKLGKRVS